MVLAPPRKRLGQHFLIDAAKIEEIVAAVGPCDTAVEIGPGRGALTEPLARQARCLIAIEKDPDLADYLTQAFADCPGVTIRCADAQREDLGAYPQGLRLVGNLPYNIATALLQGWMELRTHVQDFTIMVQREVAQRIVAAPGDSARGQLSVLTQLLMDAQPLFDLGPECFDPPPKVISTVLRLVPRKILPIEEDARSAFAGLVRGAFAARRKTLRNNLPKIPEAVWAAVEIDPGRRAETLSGEEFVRLHQAHRPDSGESV